MSVAVVRRAAVAAALLVSCTAGAAWAQSSAILGTVLDAQTRAPVAGVTVTATSPNLNAEQTATTDATGNYRLSQLPPGTYTLRFSASGYLPTARGDQQLRLNRTIRVNVELMPGAGF